MRLGVLGPFALGVFGVGVAADWGLLFALTRAGHLTEGLACALGGSTTVLAGLLLFALASVRRQQRALLQAVAEARAALGAGQTKSEARLAQRLLRQTFDPLRYWADRAARMGAPAVGDVGWDEADWSRETRHDVEVVIERFCARWPKPARRALDYGCGVGRFTSTLAERCEHGAVGLDATESLLEIAERDKTSDKARFQRVTPGRLPFPDEHFDVVWVSYVFIHVLGEAKGLLANELDRVLAPGGAICIIEGVNTWRTGSPHCEFVPWSWYQRAFPYGLDAFERVSLEPLDDAAVDALMEARRPANEDLHLVMIGNKPVGGGA